MRRPTLCQKLPSTQGRKLDLTNSGGIHYGRSGKKHLKINATLEDYQAEFQPTMVEYEGTMFYQTCSILIDPDATLSYISPRVVEQCKLQVVKFKDPWLVQLATGEKRRVLSKVSNYPLKLDGQPIIADLIVLPLESCDILIGMDWLEKH